MSSDYESLKKPPIVTANPFRGIGGLEKGAAVFFRNGIPTETFLNSD
jgi:hypothetical protein